MQIEYANENPVLMYGWFDHPYHHATMHVRAKRTLKCQCNQSFRYRRNLKIARMAQHR